jgi:hypothetical protein
MVTHQLPWGCGDHIFSRYRGTISDVANRHTSNLTMRPTKQNNTVNDRQSEPVYHLFRAIQSTADDIIYLIQASRHSIQPKIRLPNTLCRPEASHDLRTMIWADRAVKAGAGRRYPKATVFLLTAAVSFGYETKTIHQT